MKPCGKISLLPKHMGILRWFKRYKIGTVTIVGILKLPQFLKTTKHAEIITWKSGALDGYGLQIRATLVE